VVEHLPSMYKVLASILRTGGKKRCLLSCVKCLVINPLEGGDFSIFSKSLL
jgi:hypothetical protein